MKQIIIGVFLAALCSTGAVSGSSTRLAAQGTPQGAGATLPRTADRKPDFSGVWQVLNTAFYNIEDHNAEPGIPAGQGVVVGGTIPYLPAALEQRKKNHENRATEDTDAKCYMPGVPRLMYAPYPFRFVQTPTEIEVIAEYIGTVRHIYTNGTQHPPGPIDWWMGDSRARWEGDTLVVDVVHFQDNKTWFDKAGNFHSGALHVVERYSFIDKDHLNYEVTIEDPNVFSRPWKMQMPIYRRIEPNVRVLEYYCYGFEGVFDIPRGHR